jgi:NADP-dependent 3-hydroxy acid dehydrogenase YdfG
MAGRNTSRGAAIYNTTKFAIRGFALAHRQDLHGTGVGVSVVEPTFVSEAGMFVDSGAPLPTGVRTVTPDDVARAVIRSIENDVAEIVVAPIEQKLQSAIGLVAPSVNAWLQRTIGIDDVFAADAGAAGKG